MGDCARMNSAMRFIAEFGEDLEKSIHIEDWLPRRLNVDMEEDGDSCVRFMLTMGNRKTDEEVVFKSESILYDPESQDAEIDADRVFRWLENNEGLDGEKYNEIIERFKKVGL